MSRKLRTATWSSEKERAAQAQAEIAAITAKNEEKIKKRLEEEAREQERKMIEDEIKELEAKNKLLLAELDKQRLEDKQASEQERKMIDDEKK